MKQLALLLTLCFSINAAAETTGEIFGTVVDQNGEALPGVVVTAASPSMAEDKSAVSTESGNFIFRMMPIGNYRLKATMPGMKDEKVDIEVTLLEPARVTIVLVPQATEESGDLIEPLGP